MALREELNGLLDTIYRMQADAAAEQQRLAAERDALAAERAALDGKVTDAEKTIADAGGVAEIAAKKAALDGREEAIVQSEIAWKTKYNELVRWENRLADIEQRQKSDADALATAKAELETDKQTYKEKLKADFLEEVKRTLPH